MVNRRQAIKTLGGLAGATALSRLLPGCGDDAGKTGITNIVYMMLENRSYDHYFGARSMLEGLPGDGLTMQMSNPDEMGNPIAPWLPNVNQMCDPDPPHDWDAQHASWDMGKCDGFVIQHQMSHMDPTLIDPMQYLARTQLPVSWALADAYTSCDRWFCSVMGPTLPNRAYWHLGTSAGIQVNNEVLTSFASGLPVPSIYNLLHDKKIDWAYYYGSIPVVSILSQAGPYMLDLGPTDGTGNVRRFGDDSSGIGQFFTDAAKGNLPTVTYIDPAFFINDDHPPVHPINGQALIAAVYQALATSPQWKNTLLLITYDENGGFFDHVSPPTTTDDTLASFGVDGFEQMGFRVPAMVIGPYVKSGYVSSVVYDHTSALKHLINTFDLASLNPRVDAANDLSDCLDMDRLMKGNWAPPIQLPQFSVDDWPQPAAQCTTNASFRKDPISEWADDHPDKIAGKDLRPDAGLYQKSILDYLANQGLIKSR